METIPIDEIPMRSHAQSLAILAKLDRLHATANKTAREDYSRDTGIVGRPVFAYLKSIDLSSSFPYDIMHLLFENLVPNMIRHWTGQFKGLDQGNQAYELAPADWAEIGIRTAQATRTIPSAFIGTIPDIAEDGNLFKAEAHSFWIQYMAPILLHSRLPEPYYRHALLIREIVTRCTQYEITHEEINKLEETVNRFVTKYEE
ncbi:hypothetical protein FRC08_015655 [Ceratobasidium sp. 394]|nr:hypothetical protein FRC08_015655 [Ceratobasidium sp. 394]